MADLEELRGKAVALRKRKEYNNALVFYEKMLEDYSSFCNEWDLWGYAYCFKKLERYSEALPVCRELYRLNRDFEPGRNLYGWVVYHLEIRKNVREFGKGENDFFRAAGAVVKLCEGDRYSFYTPYVKTVFNVIDYLKVGVSFPWREIFKWSSRLDPLKLSCSSFSYKDKKGKVFRLPSYREKWYLVRTEALEKLGEYEVCSGLCSEALSSFSEGDFINSVWIKRRLSLCKWKMGNREEALEELKGFLNFKKEWFIQHEVAEILYELGKFDDALEYAVDGMLNYGELEKKWKLFFLGGLILKELGKKDFAGKHFLFAFKIREEKGWKIPEKMEKVIYELKVDTGDACSLKELYKDLRKYWNGLRFSDKCLFKGYVKRILSAGKSGFIMGDNGKDYYFKVSSFRGEKNKLVEGVRVKFFVVKSFDRKKKKESEEAVNIIEF